MIKLFRNIRKSLLAEGKTSKYLKYAIGEIILVVIGILIALQINNWNENQKLKKEEIKLLHALEKEIESNITSLDTTIKDNDDILKISARLLSEGLLNPNYNSNPAEIIQSLGYNTNKYETSIINEIFRTNSRTLISSDETIAQLRTLKQAYDRSDDTQLYVDEFWNNKVMEYFTKSGLGIYIGTVKIDKSYKTEFPLNNEFYSLLGIMNGCQFSLNLSRKDLKEELSNTLTFLKKNLN